MNISVGEENWILRKDAIETQEVAASGDISYEVLKNMKLKVTETEQKFTTAGPTEILHRSFKDFHYVVQFSAKLSASDDYCCSVDVKSPHFVFDHFKKCVWKGEGRSKTSAKADAMLNLLKDIKKD